MTILTRTSLLAAVLAAGLAQPATPNDAAAAAIAAGIAGVAVGAALSNSARYHNERPRGSFSPKPGVICYDKSRACYHDDGSFAASATWKYF